MEYRAITHPSVGAVPCPFCGAHRGVPCHKVTDNSVLPPDRNYVETHMARVKRAEKVASMEKQS